MRIHLIAIGGSAMHNLAIALLNKGYNVTGSDDQIFEPSKSRLDKFNLLPKKEGWFPEKITKKLDCVILGMHAKKDNIELIEAQKLNIPIYSYPEYIYNLSKLKKRVVIGGSHGKTSITAMILHIVNRLKLNYDYLVGAHLKGFNNMVKLTDAPVIIIEGDEYLSSPIDRRPKFHLYKPHISVISGISWDHINVFPTFETYLNQFRIFKNITKDKIIYFEGDQNLIKIINEGTNCNSISYKTPEYKIVNGQTKIGKTILKIFGKHNLENLEAARLVCNELEINNKDFFKHIATFEGAQNRLELIKKNTNSALYKDFAHSPSKLKASCSAIKNQFPKTLLIACMELHTFSSLNKSFLKEYKGTMNDADIGIIYINKKSLKSKGFELITKKDISEGFENKNLLFFDNSEKLKKYLISKKEKKRNLLMMSSGNFDGIELDLLI